MSRSQPLPDRVASPMRVLFVGINPGVRSAAVGHHFAGHSNRFWRLLFDSGLTVEQLRAEDDAKLADYGYGITNLVDRPTPGIDTLAREEYTAGLRVLRRKVRRWRPKVVALVGVTLFRVILPGTSPDAKGRPSVGRPVVGLQPETFEGALVFVLPNPSGRNAHYSYADMRDAFASLSALMGRELYNAKARR